MIDRVIDKTKTDLAAYLARRAALAKTPAPRPTCERCRKALNTCYCAALRPFASPVPFVILQHDDEARNAIATARMAHLSMTNSTLIVGREFGGNAQVDALIADTSRRNLVLFPSADAMPLADVFAEQEADSRPVVFWVLDAKWAQINKMLRLSPNVRALPQVKFEPPTASTFRIRRQPRAACVSTIESIHLVIERFQRHHRLQTTDHAALLEVFRHLVRQQLDFVNPELDTRHQIAKRRRAERRHGRSNTSLHRT